MSTIVFTGFPGFIGAEVLARVLERGEEDIAVCVVRPKSLRIARQRVVELVAEHPRLTGRIRLVPGDITRPGFDLDAPPAIQREATEVYHFAAVHDPGARRERAIRVNVDGTRHALEFAEGCAHLRRFHHLSTCLVSGRFPGIFTEDDLDRGQRFNNWYEESKYLAEIEVQIRVHGGLPATVYRPSLVVGDSTTGATRRYDGPYFLLRWLLRQPRVAFIPVVDDPTALRINLVPRDFVADAVGWLGGLDRSAGRVYQLADPDPPTVDEMLEILGQVTGRRLVRVPLSPRAAKVVFARAPGLSRLTRIPASLIDYLAHPTHYTTTHTDEDLAGSGIRVPRFASYADRLVEFARAHPHLAAEPVA